jgi:hypothetical protein
MEQLSTEQLNTHPVASRSPSPQMVRDVPPLVIQKKPSKSEPDLSIQTVTEPEVTVDMNDSSVSVSNRSEEIDGTRSKDSSAISDSTRYSTNVEVAFTDMARRAEKPDLDPDHSTKLEAEATHVFGPLSSGCEALPSERTQLDPAKKLHTDFVDEREGERQYAASPETARLPESGKDVHVGGDLNRRFSVESSSSLVATMRERYDVRPVSHHVHYSQYNVQMILLDGTSLSFPTRFASSVPEGVGFSHSLDFYRAI